MLSKQFLNPSTGKSVRYTSGLELRFAYKNLMGASVGLFLLLKSDSLVSGLLGQNFLVSRVVFPHTTHNKGAASQKAAGFCVH